MSGKKEGKEPLLKRDYSSGYGASPSAYAPAPLAAVESPTFKGEVPEVDVDEGNAIQPPEPSVPSASMFDELPNYGAQGVKDLPQPCPYMHQSAPASRPRGAIPPPEQLSEIAARAALLKEVESHFCWGKAAARDLSFVRINAASAFHYTLESFTERRSSCWAFEPYSGQAIDSQGSGVPPLPWEVPATPPTLFKDSFVEIEVPHTAAVKTCHHCAGFGRIRCHQCCGRGKLRCSGCKGAGHAFVDKNGIKTRETCKRCFGVGRRRCHVCSGHGQVNCPVCLSRGSLKTFVKLTVTWTNHYTEHVVEKLAIPNNIVTRGQGTLLYEEENSAVSPISDFPEVNVNTGSAALLQRHATSWPTERILHQRHSIRSIPVHEARFMYKDQMGAFWVYGLDRMVHAPTYPARICWGCSVM